MDNLQAEQAVIGALLIKPSLIDDVVEILEPSNFQKMEYGIIYSAINEIDGSLDIIVLAEYLAKKGLLEQIGGMSFLSEIYDVTSSSANAVIYAKLVKESSQIRQLNYKVNELAISLRDAKDYKSAQVQVSSILDSVEVEADGYKPFKDIVKGQIMELDARFKAGGGFNGLATGYDGLDSKFNGLRGGDYWVIGARPSMGKTAFSLALCANMLRDKKTILYFSAESTKESLTDRMITAASGVSSNLIKTAKLQDGDWVGLQAGVQNIMDYNFHIIDIAGIDIAHAKAIAKKFNRKGTIDAIFIDYVQLMTCKKSKGDFEAVSNISRGLKAMAKDNNCPVIALAQLSRGVEQRNDKRPMMSDLRATGQIEQDADFITFLYRDEYYNDDSLDKGITQVLTRKNREGLTGNDFFNTDFERMRYSETNYVQPETTAYKPFAKG